MYHLMNILSEFSSLLTFHTELEIQVYPQRKA